MYLKDMFKNNMMRLKEVGYSEEESIEIFNNGITESELEELITKNKLKIEEEINKIYNKRGKSTEVKSWEDVFEEVKHIVKSIDPIK